MRHAQYCNSKYLRSSPKVSVFWRPKKRWYCDSKGSGWDLQWGPSCFYSSFFCFLRHQEYLPPPRPFLPELGICCGSLWCQVKVFRELVTAGEGRTASMGSPVYHKPLWTILHAVRRSTPCALYGNLVRVQFLCLILYSRFVHFILL